MAVPRALPVVLAVALTALVAREALHVARTDFRPRPRIDESFAPLVVAATGEARVGWLAPAAEHADSLTHRIHAQYAFAPTVVVTGADRTRLVLVWTARPQDLADVARDRGLRVVLRGDDGYALLERP